MEIIKNTKELSSKSEQNALSALLHFNEVKHIPLDKICFFDIETTGLSADISSVYLVGCCQINKNRLEITQWFADDYTSEFTILSCLTEYLKDFQTIVHYNGTGFDLPYIEKKCTFYGLESPFSHLQSLDFYKHLRSLKSIFPFENLKLTTVESFLRIPRSDRFTGRDCIQLYSDFMQMKYLQENEKRDSDRYCLLLHNFEDIIGTFLCSQLLLYLMPFYEKHLPEQTKIYDNSIQIRIQLPGLTPASFSSYVGDLPFTFRNHTFELELPLLKGELYYFYKDYKNYYYLPFEDKALHKSVAAFADPQYRQKATSKNCYIRHSGSFIPAPAFKKTDTECLSLPLFFNRERTHAYLEWHGTLPSGYMNLIHKK